jgi:Tol biopolymer transport system component
LVTQVGTGRIRNRTQGAVDVLANTGATRGIGFTGDGAEIWLRGTQERRMRLLPYDDGQPRPFLGDRVHNAAWTADGTRLVYQTGGRDDQLFVDDRNGSNPTKIFESGHSHGPVWAPDGQWIYFIHSQGDGGSNEVWRIRPSVDPVGDVARLFRWLFRLLFRLPPEPAGVEVMVRRTGYVLKLAPLDSRTLLYTATGEDGAGPWLWALDVETRSSRRVSWGLERYTSIAASADGRRLVATVSRPQASLWSVPIGSRPASPADARPYQVPGVRAWGPRVSGRALFYLSAQGTADGLWRYRDGESVEIWRGSQGELERPAAISPDGLQAAIVLRKEGRRTLTLVETDGSQSRTLGGAIDIVGTPDWSPDGSWLVAGGSLGDERGLFKIPVAGGPPIQLVSDVATDPRWSPKGDLILYKGRSEGGPAPLLGVRPDGGGVELPVVEATGDLRFLPDGRGAVFVRGGSGVPRAFWLLDLSARKTRPLTEFPADPKLGELRHLDISSDGKDIIFDRSSDNSDIVLIDLPQRK